MLPPAARTYVINGLSATPVVVDALLSKFDSDDAIWDHQLDPSRFTLREALAHMADWEAIWMDRISLIRTTENPTLPNMDEGQIAQDRNYESSDPKKSMDRLRSGRAALMSLLKEPSDEEWARTGIRVPMGQLTLENLCSLILGHDAYHLKQIGESVR